MSDLIAKAKRFLVSITPIMVEKDLIADEKVQDLFELLGLCYMTGAEEERIELTQWNTATLPDTPRQVLIKCQDGNDGKVRYTVGYRTEEWNSPTLTHYDKVLGWREIAEAQNIEELAKL